MIYHKFTLVVFLLWVNAAADAQKTYTLKDALTASRTNNLFLKSASLNIPAAQSDILFGKHPYNPSLGVNYINITSNQYSAPGKPLIHPLNSQYAIQVAKSFSIAGQRKYKIEFAEKNVVTTQKLYAEEERNVLFETGNKWLDAWFGKVTLDLITAAKRNIDTLVQTNEVRLRNQVISSSEFTRTQLLSDQYQLQLSTADLVYKNELQILKLLMGTTDSIMIDINDRIPSINLINELDSLIRLSYLQRSDLQAAQSTIEAAKTNIELQKSLVKPVPQLGLVWNPQNQVPYLGIFGAIELPIFNRNKGGIQKSNILLQQSEQSFSALQRQVETEVQTTFNNYQLNKESIEKHKQMLEKSEKVLQAVKYAYTKGGTTLIDFLDAQRTWFDIQKAYYEAEYNYRKSYLQLLFVTGLINQL